MLRVRRNFYFILETNHFLLMYLLSSVSDISRVAAVVQAVVQKDGKKYGGLDI
jgi:hypothetical protein